MAANTSVCTIFGYYVNDPNAAVLSAWTPPHAVSLEEKPLQPKSNWRCRTLFYPAGAATNRAWAAPSARGEAEITGRQPRYLEVVA